MGADKQVWCRLLVFPPETSEEPRKKHEQKVRVKGSRHDVQVGQYNTRLLKGGKGKNVRRKAPTIDA